MVHARLFGIESTSQETISHMVPLLLAKISIPHRAKPLVRRERLLRLLHDNVQRRLTLISSGAGYGKTALLVDYAHDTTLPVCWYSLDESDADLSVFVAYLVASLGQRFPAIGSTALDELVADSNLDNRPSSLARLLLDVIERQTDGLFCLVLDDLHHVLCSPEIVEFLNTFIRFKTDRCSLIISSREVPQGLSLAYWRAYGEVLVLDAALCFDGDETIALARLRQSGLSHAELAWLTEQSQGWVTAILLMMDSWRGSGAPRSVPA